MGSYRGEGVRRVGRVVGRGKQGEGQRGGQGGCTQRREGEGKKPLLDS